MDPQAPSYKTDSGQAPEYSVICILTCTHRERISLDAGQQRAQQDGDMVRATRKTRHAMHITGFMLPVANGQSKLESCRATHHARSMFHLGLGPEVQTRSPAKPYGHCCRSPGNGNDAIDN